MAIDVSCPACCGTALTPVVALPDLPVFCNVLADTAVDASRAPTGGVELVQCGTCGMLVNARFDPQLARYRPGYENSLHHSETFQSWARSLADRLVDAHDLQGGSALELGCGGGGFLSLLCEAGMAKAVGYDPSFDGRGGDGTALDPRIEIRAGFLEEQHQHRADLAVCRHVLEHVTDPAPLVELLTTAAPDGVLYLEVPDATTMLRDGGVYDVIYEHCSYFGAPAMQALLARTGLGVLDLRQEFGGQYLAVEAAAGSASPRPPDPAAVEALRRLGQGFGERTSVALRGWAERLEERLGEERDVVVWGAGSKGVTFVNLVAGGHGISRLVDVNPLKRGRFVPGAAQPVVAPADLVQQPPDVVIVMNPLYRAEVSSMLDELAITAEVLVA